MGSLLKVHFSARPISDYRSVYPSEHEARLQQRFHLGLLNRGVLVAGYGLMALSTPMTDSDVAHISSAIDATLAEIARLPPT